METSLEIFPPGPRVSGSMQHFSLNFNLTVTRLMDVRYLSLITQQTWWRAVVHMLIKPQLQPGELIPTVDPPSTQHPTPFSLHWCLPHHSTQNIPPLIGLCSSNMFVMKKQHIILSLLAGRAQFTKVEVGDKQRHIRLQSAPNNESPRCQGWAEYNWVQHLWALSP